MSYLALSTGEQQRERVLREQLCQRAGVYYPELAERSVRVELVASSRRQFSRVYRFCILGGDVPRHVFVKVPSNGSLREPPERAAAHSPPRDRPRLVPLLSAEAEASLEYAGLKSMMDHFVRRGDPRLHSPKVLDLLDGLGIVVENIDLPTLSRALYRAHRFQMRPAIASLLRMFHCAGAWLKVFHEMPIADSSPSRLAGRRDVVSLFGEFIAFLHDASGQTGGLDALHEQFIRYAEALLPAELPLVTGHGDFGPHNLFVAPKLGVVGFDTLACWRAPALEDLAYFLMLLETVPPLFVSRTVALRPDAIAACRCAFLDSYGAAAAGAGAHLRLFEILITTEKWVSAVHSCQKARGARALAKRCRLAVQQRCLRGRLDYLFDDLSKLAGGKPPAFGTGYDRGIDS